MAKLVVKDMVVQCYTCYDEIGLCVQNRDIILGLIDFVFERVDLWSFKAKEDPHFDFQ